VVTAESDCAGCHLPTESEAFHGTPFTDHWIRLPGNPPTPASAAGRRELAWLEELYRRRMPEENPPAKAARLRAGLAELLHIRGARGEAQALLREALDLGADYETRLKAGALFRDGGHIPEALELFQEALRFPTYALEQAGNQPVGRDEIATNALPGDRFGLAPASSRDLGEEAWMAHLSWGAAKAAAITRDI